MASVFVLTGAGISAESGVRTFRGPDGLWEGHRVEDVATPEGFLRDPELVYRFYNGRRRMLPEVRPNAAHEALARLDREFPGRVTIVTQNIDDLHERAGSAGVLHMHGELMKARCVGCAGVFPWASDLGASDACPGCGEVGRLRPHVVWFGEVPLGLEEIFEAIDGADYFVAVGTSGLVHPAAGFAAEADRAGAMTIEVNIESTPVSPIFREHRRGAASVEVPRLVEWLLAAG
jgi:NAD-dependent deacetylase